MKSNAREDSKALGEFGTRGAPGRIDQTCVALRELHKKRQDLHGAEKSMTNRVHAVCHRALTDGTRSWDEIQNVGKVLYTVVTGAKQKVVDAELVTIGQVIAPHCAAFLAARTLLEKERKAIEKQMEAIAKTLPIAPWVLGVRGVALLSLAQIVAEAGPLDNYPTVQKLWKRMGLAVINGERQRKTSDNYKEHGYNPQRCALMWVISDNFVKLQAAKPLKGMAAGPYRLLYDERKAYEATSVTKGHAHNRAKRYIAKRFLRDLWQAWRETKSQVDSQYHVVSPRLVEGGKA